VERLKAWLREQGIEIVRPGLGAGGLVTLRLRRSDRSEFEIDFYPDELEANPESAIAYLKTFVRRERF
jgi:hypothetical protein